ncbi:phospholipase D-like domain-containing protein [Orrella sp. JC864]|uniref:phospholipase D-like domain-containing protein n=1 Tax=Orrella sp. JC864 TaxID=3120298 RepID=UPI003008E308
MTAGRWAGAAVACLVLACCATVPSPRELSEQRAQVRAAQQYGSQGYRESRDIVARAGPAHGQDFLRYHLQVEQAVSKQPLTPGNQVRLLTDGPATYRAMQQAIARARHYIRLETYIFDDDEVGQLFADLLIERARQGVDVAVMVDAVGTLTVGQRLFERMRQAGIPVVVFNPVNPLRARAGWSPNERSHRKILVADGEVGFLGGINVSGVYASSALAGGSAGSGSAGGSGGSGSLHGRTPSSDQAPWRDTHIEIRGPAVARIDEVFMDGWLEQGGPPLAVRQRLAPPGEQGPLHVRILANQPGEQDGYSVYLTLMSAIQSAQRSIHVTMAYFAPDPAFVQALEDAARRGVDVVLVLPGFTDSALVLHAGRSHYAGLLRAGVKIHERRDALLHAKTLVVDGVWSTVGSSNLDWRSFALNHEINAVILGADFGAQMEAVFRQDVQAAEPVTLEQWQARGLGQRFMEGFSRLFERWL